MWLNEKALPERCLKFRRVSRQLHRMLCRILYEKEVQGVRAPKKLLFYIGLVGKNDEIEVFEFLAG